MKSLFSILLFSVNVICSAVGLIFLKMALSDKKINLNNIFQIIFDFKFISGMLLYTFGFLIWLYILSKYNLNVALPIAQSLFFIVTIGGSFFFLRESLNSYHIAGILFCLLGILLIAVK